MALSTDCLLGFFIIKVLDRREIVRPKRYMTTSSSDKEQVITSRDKSQSNETIDFESNFREIRDALTINKENEAANVNWPIEHTSSRTMNSPSLQSVNPTTQSNNTNTTSTLEQSSVPEKTYIELLPSNLTQGLNICTTNSLHVHGSQVERIPYENSYSNTSSNEFLHPQNNAHHNQATSMIKSSQAIENISDQPQENFYPSTSFNESAAHQNIAHHHQAISTITSPQVAQDISEHPQKNFYSSTSFNEAPAQQNIVHHHRATSTITSSQIATGLSGHPEENVCRNILFNESPAKQNIGRHHQTTSTITSQQAAQNVTGHFQENSDHSTSFNGSSAQRDITHHREAISTSTPNVQGISTFLQENSYVATATINEEQSLPSIPTVRARLEKNTLRNSNDNNPRDKEVCRNFYQRLNNLVSKEDLQSLRDEFNEHYRVINNKLDRLLHKRTNMLPQKPPLFPLQSVQQVTDFNNISDEEYENAVEYLHFLGGFTLHDAVKFCLKEAITDDTIKNFSAWGEHGNLPLFNTMLIKAVYDAVCMNLHFPKPMRDEFLREVGEAVRFGKQRNRNAIKKANEGETGRRRRLRHQADVHL